MALGTIDDEIYILRKQSISGLLRLLPLSKAFNCVPLERVERLAAGLGFEYKLTDPELVLLL